MDKNNKNKISLFDAVRLGKKDMYWSLWRIEINFNITNHNDLKAYCKKNGLIQLPTKDIYQEFEFKIDKEFVFNKIKDLTFYSTGIFENKFFKSFGIHEKSANIYGHKLEEIEMLSIKISDDQNKTSKGYWGFFEYDDWNIESIDNCFQLMSLRVGHGAIEAESRGNGFAIKIDIEIINEKFIKNWWNNLTDMKRIEYTELVMLSKLDAQEIRQNISYDEIKRIFNYCYLTDIKK